MWHVLNRTPFEAAGAFARDADGRELWCVAVRATFDLGDARFPRRSDTQRQVALTPTYAGEQHEVLVAESDIAPFLPGSEVLVRGTVRPSSAELATLPLELELGPIRKRAVLHGRRVAERGWLGWSDEQVGPVVATPLTWQATFGGRASFDAAHGSSENPVGQGFDRVHSAKVGRGHRVELPRILAPDGALKPLGFGAVHRSWQPRASFAGTHDDAWRRTRSPLPPRDQDPRFAFSAPLDQTHAQRLKGGEPTTLSGFFPEGTVAFRLPQAVLEMTARVGTALVSSRFELARVEIELDQRQLAMLWTTTVDCNGRDQEVRGGRVYLKQLSGATA